MCIRDRGATDNGDDTWSLNGMTYDGTVHTVTVAVSDEENTQGEGMHIVATPSMQPADVKFTNVYDPTDITISEDTKDAIHGTKVLDVYKRQGWKSLEKGGIEGGS